MSLVGKFFFHMGKEYSHSGQIIEQIDANTVLIKIDHCEHVPDSMMIVPVAPMVSKIDKDGSVDSEWEFFGSREELDEWLEWLETPSEPAEAEKKSATIN